MLIEHHAGTGLYPLAVGTDEHREAWLPRLGPTAYLLALDLARRENGSSVSASELARRLGVSEGKLKAALVRLDQFRHVSFGPVQDGGEQVLAVRLVVWLPRPVQRRSASGQPERVASGGGARGV